MDNLLHVPDSLLDDFLHGRLGEEESRFVLHHLNECNGCRSLLIFSISGARYLESLFGQYQPREKNDQFVGSYRRWINLQTEGWEFPNVVWIAHGGL